MLRVDGDFFDRARVVAAIGLLAAGVLAVTGSLLEWVAIEVEAELVPGSDFGNQQVDNPDFSPVQGIESIDGVIVLVAGVALSALALRVLIRRKGGWLAFVISMVIGGIGVADYRGANDLNSGLCERMGCLGDIKPGVGLLLVASAGVVGLISAVAAVAATPRIEPDQD